ncbi:hypothetical protein ACO0QE_001110 [Hanseniaspora vineae]
MSSVQIIGPFTNTVEFTTDLLKKIGQNDFESFFKELHIKTGVDIDSMVVKLYCANQDTPAFELAPRNNSDGNAQENTFNYNTITKIVVGDTNENSVANQLSKEDALDQDGNQILSNEKYQQLDDSVYKWKKSLQNEIQLSIKKNVQYYQDHCLGKKVEISKDGRVGVLRYVGHIKELEKSKQYFCGVEFTEPIGKNNGCFQNNLEARYFGPVEQNHGLFVPLAGIRVLPDATDMGQDQDDGGIEEL